MLAIFLLLALTQDIPAIPEGATWRAKEVDWKMREFVSYHNSHVVKSWIEFDKALDAWAKVVVEESQKVELPNAGKRVVSVEELRAWGEVKRRFAKFEKDYKESLKRAGKVGEKVYKKYP